MGPREVFQLFDDLRIGIGPLGIFHDGRRRQEKQRGFPQIERGQVPLERIDGAVGPAIELRQGQWQTPDQFLVKKGGVIHDSRTAPCCERSTLT